jgi:hypothetical protein
MVDRRRLLVLVMCAFMGACSGDPAPKDPKTPTVFDDLVDKKRAIPAAVQRAERQPVEDLKRQEAVDDATPASEPAR